MKHTNGWRFFELPCLCLVAVGWLIYFPMACVEQRASFWGVLVGGTLWLVQGYCMWMIMRYLWRRELSRLASELNDERQAA